MDGLTQVQMPTRNPRRVQDIDSLIRALNGAHSRAVVDQGPSDAVSQELMQFGQLPQDQEPDWVMNAPAPNGNLPDQTTALGQALMQEGADYGIGIARQGIGQGMMLGAGDEAEAWLRSRGSDRSYEDLHTEIDGQNKQFFEENTKASMAAQFAGGMVLPSGAILKPLQLASKIKNPITRALAKGTTYTATGATAGTIYGHNTGTGEIGSDNRMQGAKEGGVVGALLGPAVPVAANAVMGAGGAMVRALRGGAEKIAGMPGAIQDAALNAGRNINMRQRKAMQSDNAVKMTESRLAAQLADQDAEAAKSLYGRNIQQAHTEQSENLVQQELSRRQFIPQLEREKVQLEIEAMRQGQTNGFGKVDPAIEQRLGAIEQELGQLQGAAAQRQGADPAAALLHQRPGAAVQPASPGASSHKPSGQADPSSTVSNPVDSPYGPPVTSADSIAHLDGLAKQLMGVSDRVGSNAGTLGRNQQTLADGISDSTRMMTDQNHILAGGISDTRKALAKQLMGIDDRLGQALKGHRTPLEAMPSEYSAINRSVMSRLLKDPQTAKGPLSPAGIAENLNAQYRQAGLKRVDLNELSERVGNTFDITRTTNRVLGLDMNKGTGKPRKHVGQDKIRRKLLAEALGNPGTLAIPAAIGAGAAYSPDQFDELRRQLMEIN